jgi:hypothetical protein
MNACLPFDLLARARAITSVASVDLLTSTEKLVLVMLISRMNDRAETWPGIKRLARDCSITPNTARKVTRELEKFGYLRITKRATASGVDTSFLYRLVRLPGEAATTAPSHREDGAPSGATPVLASESNTHGELREVSVTPSEATEVATAKQLLRSGGRVQPLHPDPSAGEGGTPQSLQGEGAASAPEPTHRTDPSGSVSLNPQTRVRACGVVSDEESRDVTRSSHDVTAHEHETRRRESMASLLTSGLCADERLAAKYGVDLPGERKKVGT